MAVAAAARVPGLRVLDLELRRPGLSYTVDTLAELAERYPSTRVWLVLGADAAREVGSWHRAGEVLDRAWFVLVNRSGVPTLDAAEAERLGFDPARTRVVAVDSPAVSATEIRRRVVAGRSIAAMVPPEVAALIVERGLYRGREHAG
jgi:nicotinate-nucleotide adenylyltransferase